MKNQCGEGIKEFFFKFFSIQKITDMLKSNHHLSLYVKLIVASATILLAQFSVKIPDSASGQFTSGSAR